MRKLAFFLLITGLSYFPPLFADAPVIDEWQVPWNSTRPRDPDVAPNGDTWFVGQGGDYVATGVQPNQFVGFEPSSGDFISSVPLESGEGTVRHMVYDAARNEIWFGTDTNTIGRAQLPEIPDSDHR